MYENNYFCEWKSIFSCHILILSGDLYFTISIILFLLSKDNQLSDSLEINFNEKKPAIR